MDWDTREDACQKSPGNNGRVQSNQPRRQQYENYPHQGYNQPQRREDLPSLNPRGPRLAVLEEGLYDDEFIAPFQQNETKERQTMPTEDSKIQAARLSASAPQTGTLLPSSYEEMLKLSQKVVQQPALGEAKLKSILKSPQFGDKRKVTFHPTTADHSERQLPSNLILEVPQLEELPVVLDTHILGDPGAVSGGEGKS